jgi:hypothetical protein
VVVRGRHLPDDPIVLVGGARAVVSTAVDGTRILATTSAHLPGLVDVTVADRAGNSGVLAAAFTYLPDGSQVAPPLGDSPTTTTTAPGPPSPTPTTQPSDVVHEARGLRLRPIGAGHPLGSTSPSRWPSLRCTTGSCPGTPLR